MVKAVRSHSFTFSTTLSYRLICFYYFLWVLKLPNHKSTNFSYRFKLLIKKTKWHLLQLSETLNKFPDIPYEVENMLRRMGNTPRKKGIFEAMKLFRKGVKLGMLMTSQNVTDFDRKTIRFASPRIMPVVSNAQDDDEVEVISSIKKPNFYYILFL